MITPITATFPALNFPKEVDYPTQEDWAAFSAAAELNYGILSGEWSNKSEEFKAQVNNLAQEIQDIGENAINAITFDNIAQLKLNSNMGRVDVLGYYANGDGGGGTFYWDATSTEADNGGTIIQATGITIGRWKRPNTNIVNARQFGAKGDWNGTTGTDDTVSIQKAIDNCDNILLKDGKFIASSLNVTKNINIKGENATLIQKTNTSNISLIKNLIDTNVIIEDLIIDGNSENQPLQSVSILYGFGLVWNSIGSLKMHRCTVKNTKAHAIMIGNIMDFNATKFAHDCVIDNCTVIQPINSSGNTLSGDCIRVERTHNAIISNNTTIGGYSGIRTQLYNKYLIIQNNKCSYIYPDVGITIALSENCEVSNNKCSFNNNHGFEIDCTVNSNVLNNIADNNIQSGFAISELGASIFPNEPRFAGSISDIDHDGYNYSNQTHSSPYIPNYNLVVSGNISRNNKKADRIVGDINTIYSKNIVSNSESDNIHCISIEGATILKTSAKIIENIFYTFSNTTHCIGVSNYQFDAIAFDNKIIGKRCKLSQYAIEGNYDYNYANKYLLNPSKRSTLLVDSIDGSSITGSAVTYTTSGSTLFPFSGINANGSDRKLMRIVMKASANIAVQVAVTLYDKAGVYVATLYPESNKNITTEYISYYFIIDSYTSSGCEIRPQVRVPTSGITIYFQELNIYGTIS